MQLVFFRYLHQPIRPFAFPKILMIYGKFYVEGPSLFLKGTKNTKMKNAREENIKSKWFLFCFTLTEWSTISPNSFDFQFYASDTLIKSFSFHCHIATFRIIAILFVPSLRWNDLMYHYSILLQWILICLLSLSHSLFLPLSLSLTLYLSLTTSLSLPLSRYLSLATSLSLPLSRYLFLCLCVSLCLSVSLCFTYLF